MASDICNALGKRVRKLRKEKGWNQTYLSVHTGISLTFISEIERGKKEPCLRLVEVLANGFGLSISQLFRGL